MAIDKSGRWWVGSEPEDIKGFLYPYSEDQDQFDEFRIEKCACGSVSFSLFVDDEKCEVKHRCKKCGKEYFIRTREKYWNESKKGKWVCATCGSDEINIGVGFSLCQDHSAFRWLYIGVRCNRCWILDCFTGWKIRCEPSFQF